MAYEALKLEPRAGAMLPCNVIVREQNDGTIEVSAIDNDALQAVAGEVHGMLRDAVAEL